MERQTSQQDNILLWCQNTGATTAQVIPVKFYFVSGSDVQAPRKLPLTVAESRIYEDAAYTDYTIEDDEEDRCR